MNIGPSHSFCTSGKQVTERNDFKLRSFLDSMLVIGAPAGRTININESFLLFTFDQFSQRTLSFLEHG